MRAEYYTITERYLAVKEFNSFILASLFFMLVSVAAAESENKGMLVRFELNPENPRVLSTQNVALPIFDQASLPIDRFPSKSAFYPVSTFSTIDDQFKLLGAIGKSVPFSWKEKETLIYLVFKGKLIKPDTYLLELNDTAPSSKQVVDLKDPSLLYLPTNFTSEQELKESELYKILKAAYNPAVAKEITSVKLGLSPK